MYRHILIPTDGSDAARKGVDHGLKLAKKLGCKVTAVLVTEPYPLYATSAHLAWAPTDIEKFEESQKAFAADTLAKVARQAAKLGVKIATVHAEKEIPSEAIVQTAADRKCDLIVMASHGRRGLSRLLLGSQTSQVLHQSKVPVLVVR